MTNANNQRPDSVAYPTAIRPSFNPAVSGRNVMGIRYGENSGAKGKPIPFSQQKELHHLTAVIGKGHGSVEKSPLQLSQ